MIALLWTTGGCSGEAPEPCVLPSDGPLPESPQNVVWILLDDVGVDKVGVYDVHPRPAPTPNIDALAAQGVRFRSMYAEPRCSIGRAALLTGRRPVHTGVGDNLDGVDALPDAEQTVAELLGDAGYSTAAVGKWHLAGDDADPASAPGRQGFSRFDGILGNPLQEYVLPPSAPQGYSHWEHVVDGEAEWSTTYLTTHQADAAIALAAELPEPFFLYVAFSAAHGPTHDPPDHLWSVTESTNGTAGQADAMIEALDQELGRLLAAVQDRAVIFLTSDNGTQDDKVRPPADPLRAKTTVYTGGVHVPLLVVGGGLQPAVRDGLAHLTDLLPTALQLAGLDAEALTDELALDGTSLWPLAADDVAIRTCVQAERFSVFAEPFGKDHQRTVLQEATAYIEPLDGPDELYLRDPGAPVEGEELLDGSITDAQREDVRRARDLLRFDERSHREEGR